MNIGLTRLSGNITDRNSSNVGNTELFAIGNILRNKFNVDILSCKSCKNCVTVDENFDINRYDSIFVLNDSSNMFGGAEIPTMTTLFKVLHNFDKQIYFILTDLSLPMIDYYDHIKDKVWASNYSKDDFTLKYPINILSQGKDFNIISNIHKKISYNNIYYVPWHIWKIFYPDKNKNFSNFFNTPEKTVDLIYGGSFRGGRRKKKFLDYFFNRNIKVELYGNIKESNFSDCEYSISPTFSSVIPNYMVTDKNNSSISTIIMGDKNYNNNMVTLRFIEALLADDVICFIDNDFDTMHTLLDDDYFYVSNGEELELKINNIKNDSNLKERLLNIQNEKLNSLKNIDICDIINNIFIEDGIYED